MLALPTVTQRHQIRIVNHQPVLLKSRRHVFRVAPLADGNNRSQNAMRKLIFALTITLVAPVLAAPSPDIVVGFSPSDSHNAQNTVLSIINSARHSLDVAAYLFTSKPIAAALVNARKRGVSVRVVADQKANSDGYTAVTYLANHQVPVRLNGRYAIMHNKFMVADGQSVETGSFNYTASADKRNAENALLIRNAPQLAAKYQQEFNRLWDESIPLKSHY